MYAHFNECCRTDDLGLGADHQIPVRVDAMVNVRDPGASASPLRRDTLLRRQIVHW
jgi:hypothetical protein